jgi:hypothetical protein
VKRVMGCGLLLLRLAAAADGTCTWMNSATAAGILGTEVSTSVTPRVCDFSHETQHLRIEIFSPVASMRTFLNRCKSQPEALKAIGNEAVTCDGEASEQIAIGRVRDQVFVIQVKASFPKAELREKTKLASELVSGNLF